MKMVQRAPAYLSAWINCLSLTPDTHSLSWILVYLSKPRKQHWERWAELQSRDFPALMSLCCFGLTQETTSHLAEIHCLPSSALQQHLIPFVFQDLEALRSVKSQAMHCPLNFFYAILRSFCKEIKQLSHCIHIGRGGCLHLTGNSNSDSLNKNMFLGCKFSVLQSACYYLEVSLWDQNQKEGEILS